MCHICWNFNSYSLLDVYYLVNGCAMCIYDTSILHVLNVLIPKVTTIIKLVIRWEKCIYIRNK